MSDTVLPEGFGPHARKSPITDPWEPLYARAAEDRLILATWVREPHCNSRHMPHGGFLAAMADNAMGLSLGMNLARTGAPVDGLVTVSLTLDYLGSARLGQWLEFDTDFIKLGRSICFAEATVRADGVPVARARASFKVRTARQVT